VGRTKRQGLDFGISGTLDKFRWNASYSYVRATFDNDITFVANSNSTEDANKSVTARKGDSIPSIPEHQLKLRGQYQITPEWSLGANLIAYSEQYVWGNENNKHAANGAGCNAGDPGNDYACGKGKLDAYAVVNLDTQYSIGKGWKAFAKATNIFDHDYYVGGRLAETGFNSAGTFVGDTKMLGLIPGAPRAAWVGLRFEFGGDEPKKD
jgi:outer membrane receptor protein involved in Fe transport